MRLNGFQIAGTTRLLFALAMLACAGCADGPFNGGGTLNPFLKREWDKDERRGPTFHTKMRELRTAAQVASGLPPDRQQQLAEEMSGRYRSEENSLLRAGIVNVLGQMGSVNATETFALSIKDDDPDVRAATARALGQRGDEESLRLLASAMSNESNADVRLSVATELGRFRNSPDATRALALALDDNDAALQYRAIRSLEQVTGREYGVDVKAWREYLAGGNPVVKTPSLAERWSGWSWW